MEPNSASPAGVVAQLLTRYRSSGHRLDARRRWSARRPQPIDLLSRIPLPPAGLCAAGLPEGARDLTEEIAEDVRRTDWELAERFRAIAFAVGTGWASNGGHSLRSAWRDLAILRRQALSMLADMAGAEKPVRMAARMNSR